MHTHNGILFSHQRENSAILDHMEKSWGVYAKQNKSQNHKYHMISLKSGSIGKKKPVREQMVVDRGRRGWEKKERATKTVPTPKSKTN